MVIDCSWGAKEYLMEFFDAIVVELFNGADRFKLSDSVLWWAVIACKSRYKHAL